MSMKELILIMMIIAFFGVMANPYGVGQFLHQWNAEFKSGLSSD